MQLNGTITSIVPAGGYDGPSGRIYTFNMTINTLTGDYVGEIGAKSQVYPLPIGQPICVDMETNQYGIRFKKINPGYSQQPAQQQGQYNVPQAAPVQGQAQVAIIPPQVQPAAQPAPQPAAQPAPQPAAQPAPQPAAQPAPQPAAQPAPQPAAHVVPQNPVQDDIRFAQALNLAVSELVHGVIDTSLVESKAGVYYTILKTRNFPATHSNRGFQDTNNVPPVTVEDAAKEMLPEEELPF